MLELTKNQLCVLQIIVAIGAINWGLSAMKYNIVEKIFANDYEMQKYTYYAIALAGVVILAHCLKQLGVF
jgi:uncharacterized membrane protein YuzA (DUF378 family)